ncbi:hypothetical protein [Vagococcus acidifermentans]|uniref:Uncharacterized protein n=1 Tax=Vagococcus acidifermentans TaxID=564710 RepID=A0A430AWT1_9ENTE|nr:hypothetical protein [Vagococcus acidifermentans]RSU12522.1 hypothetical protein CBF27_05985 [Vagococcus acidifermentans]
MKALYKGKIAHVWEISKTGKQPEWIADLFNKHYLTWYDNRLKILVQAISPSPARNIKRGLLDTLERSYNGGYKMGDIGDFFDATNGRVISKEKFHAQYAIEIE